MWYWLGVGISALLALTVYLGIWFLNASEFNIVFWIVALLAGLIYAIFNLLLASKQLRGDNAIRAL
jgi:hypothetical protein